MAYSYPPPPVADPVVCPCCEQSDQVGQLEARQHLGGGAWAMHRLWVCARCHRVIATKHIQEIPA